MSTKHARIYDYMPWGKQAFPLCRYGKWTFAARLADVTCRDCLRLLRKRK